MNCLNFIENIMQSYIVIIMFSTLLGATARLFYKKNNQRRNKTLKEYLYNLIVDWIIASAGAFIIHSVLISNTEEIIGISIILGFIGYKETLKFIKKNFINKLKRE